ncbi:hypothetical protein PybrP1_011455 [[Pythium] brassicae (nom. inval.)]|nr:hypothetical protein PybrP1_011455 [[Pythium] brassicae (nom. inval.)]
MRVGVIGGGAAGITKTLRAAGHRVVVFEAATACGGVWRYDADAASDTSMYESLHTNLPTGVMQLDDFSFPPGVRSFPSHRDVLQYLQSYARHFRVDDVMRLGSRVTQVAKTGAGWELHVASNSGQQATESYAEEFDKLLVCNGHFSQPFFGTVKGSEHFKGTVLHSHNYRTPDAFVGKSVLLVGRGPSGQDISLELVNSGAKQVVMSCHDFAELPPSVLDKRTLKPPIDHIAPDGAVVFTDSTTLEAPDVLMYCTGYRYSVSDFLPAGILYPSAMHAASTTPKGDDASSSAPYSAPPDAALLEELERVTAAGQALAPLYKQLFSIEEPDVAFVGLPFKNLPFLCFELQAKWLARVFAGTTALPSKERMYEDFFAGLRELPFPVRKLHQLGELQSAYFRDLATLSDTKLSEVVQSMYHDAMLLRVNYPFEYRKAEYAQDPLSGRWTRTLKREFEVAIQTFE